MALFRKMRSAVVRRVRRGMGMRTKLLLALSAICAILLVSSIISVMEYRGMSNYVSGLIADNVNSINAAQKLSEEANAYNLGILAVIGDDSVSSLPDFDTEGFLARCDTLKNSLASVTALPLTDSVLYSYSAYMLASLELPTVLESDFIDTRIWYFDRLQPLYGRLSSSIDAMSTVIYNDLKTNSETFDRGFYRSIIPGIVAVGVGLLLVVMLMFFVTSYYVNPLYKMLSGLNDYRSYNRRYTYTFDGDDQLSELNAGITEITGENIQLRKRISNLKESMNATGGGE